VSPCFDDVGGDQESTRELPVSLFRPFEGNNASRHPLFGPVRHDSPRLQDLKTLAIYPEKPLLFGTDPFRIPGYFDPGNPFVSFYAVRTRVRHQAAQQVGTFLNGVCGISPFPR
jgi:hypothetical protein